MPDAPSPPPWSSLPLPTGGGEVEGRVDAVGNLPGPLGVEKGEVHPGILFPSFLQGNITISLRGR